MRVTYQEKELYKSVEFITLGLGETKVHFDHEKEPLCLIFDFKKSEKQDLSSDVLDEHTMKITFEGWNAQFPTTIKEPWEIGTFLSRQLFIIFCVSKIGSEGEFRKVNLSVYLGNEVRNDQT